MKRLAIALLLLLPLSAQAKRLAFVVALPRAPLQTVIQTFKPQAKVTQSPAGFFRVKLPIDGDPCNPTGRTLFFHQVVNSLTHPTQDSAAPSGKWRLWVAVNIDPQEEDFARTAFRWLGRRRQSNADQVVGPWTVPQFVAFIGSRTDDSGESIRDHFVRGGEPVVPWVIAGDSPKALGAQIYAPSESDIANDVDNAPEEEPPAEPPT